MRVRKQRSDDAFSSILFLVLGVLFLFMGSCRGALCSSSGAVNTLETLGFTNIRLQDHVYVAIGLRGCSAQDAARFDFLATNSAGKEVNVSVCTGLIFKGATVRGQ